MPTDSQAGNSRRITYLEALAEALDQEMARDPDVLVLGEDIGGEFGGAFKATKGLWQKYGEHRVINTPMAELGFTGMATGMALAGLRPVIEMQFADFISTAFDAIVQYAASTHYIWQGAVPWTIRAPADGGTSSGPFHSQNPEAWFAHVPGLKVICPGTPADVKGLLTSAIRDNNPVIFFESKTLYRSLRGPGAPRRASGAHRQGPTGATGCRPDHHHLRGDAAIGAGGSRGVGRGRH